MQPCDAVLPDALPAHWRPDLDPAALPPTPELSAAQRRLLQASLVHFSTRGYAGSTMRDIAASLGMQAASAYNHFTSKSMILETLILLGLEHHHETVVSAVLGAEGCPTDQLLAFVRADVRLHCQYPRLSDVVHHEWPHLAPDTYEAMYVLRARAQSLLRSIVERGRDDGEFQIFDVGLTAAGVMGFALSAAQWFPYQNEHTAEVVVEHFATAALNVCHCTTQPGKP